jgi:nucleotide-binding universal stress UspA family protein
MLTIMVPLDGSPLAEQALGIADQVARVLAGELLLIHVYPTSRLPTARLPDRAAAHAYLAKLAGRLAPEIPIQTQVLDGDPVTVLLQLGAQTPEALVVMATHGVGGVRSAAFGSVTTQVLEAAAVPVVIVPRSVNDQATALQRLILPLDGSTTAEQVLPLAVNLAQGSGALLHLVRVVEDPSPTIGKPFPPRLRALFMEQALDEARGYLQRFATMLRAQGLPVAWEVRTGQGAEEIRRAAETTGADLILLTPHGQDGRGRGSLGSVAMAVLQTGSLPVLVTVRETPSKRLSHASGGPTSGNPVATLPKFSGPANAARPGARWKCDAERVPLLGMGVYGGALNAARCYTGKAGV